MENQIEYDESYEEEYEAPVVNRSTEDAQSLVVGTNDFVSFI